MIAIEEVFDDWNDVILRSLRRRFHGTPLATLEDGAAFAWEQFAAKPPPDAYALAWLQLVARNEVLRLLRRWEQPRDPRPDLHGGRTMDTELDARELMRQVDGLKPGQRVALTCRLLGLTYKDAQQATGHTYTWVNRHIVEGRRALLDEREVAA
jgi:DNA-directed RNA polymerase specialized sigma24 family protein